MEVDRMKDINLEILKFLVEGKAYSDSAIMQNFGIDEPELKIIYENLAQEGYLEKYSEYEKRNKKENSSQGCGGECGGGCSSHNSNNSNERHSCCSSSDWDYDNIWVLTEKALKNI